MLASRLIERSRHQRRLVARLITRHALLRRTAIGARMQRVLADAGDAWTEARAVALPIDLPEDARYESAEPVDLFEPATEWADPVVPSAPATEGAVPAMLPEAADRELPELVIPQAAAALPAPAAQARPETIATQAAVLPDSARRAPPSAPPASDTTPPLHLAEQRAADQSSRSTAQHRVPDTLQLGAQPLLDDQSSPTPPPDLSTLGTAAEAPVMPIIAQSEAAVQSEAADRGEANIAGAGALPAALGADRPDPAAPMASAESFAQAAAQASTPSALPPTSDTPPASSVSAPGDPAQRSVVPPGEQPPLAEATPAPSTRAARRQRQAEPAQPRVPGEAAPAPTEPPTSLFDATAPDSEISEPPELALFSDALPNLEIPGRGEQLPPDPLTDRESMAGQLVAASDAQPASPDTPQALPDTPQLASQALPDSAPASPDAPQALPDTPQALSDPQPASPDAPQALPDSAPAPQPPAPQPRMSRRAQFEEIGTRSAPPAAARPVEPTPKPSPANEIFNRARPERDVMDWGRLLFESASQPAQREIPAPAPQIDQPSTVAPLPQVGQQPTAAPAPQVGRQPAAGRPRVMPAAANLPTPAQGIQPPEVAESQSDQPIRLAETTRRFLRPLVGVDSESVRIYRGPLADQITSNQAADAATADDAILLSTDIQDEAAPQTLGLLAHELTHVARQRTPRFVPPIARGRVGETADEETLAEVVESQARSAARAADPAYRAAYGLGAAPPAAPADGRPIGQLGEQPAGSAQDSTVWSGLPAPWEPLPGWVASAWTESAGADRPSAPGFTAPPTGDGSAGGETAGATSAFQLAEQDRSIESSAPAEAPASAAPAAAPPPTDMDALAKQVYAVLKQRLAAERRRLG